MAARAKPRPVSRGESNAAWIEQYCRIPEGKFVGQPVRLTSKQREWLGRIYDTPTRLFILSMGRKGAKALALDTPIPTPNGWRLMQDIKAGDLVYGSDGNAVRVLTDSETFIGKRCYRVDFSDGSNVVASEDHVWTTEHRYRPWDEPARYPGGVVRGNSGNGGRRISGEVTTAQIAATLHVKRPDDQLEHNHRIIGAGNLRSEPTILPIDPYLLGAWLGDGSSSCAQFTASETDVGFLAAQLNLAGAGDVTIARYSDRAPRVSIGSQRKAGNLQSKMRAIGLLGNKHIPSAYFDAGTSQRWALLQGLMDTDGTVTRSKTVARCSFSNTNEKLAYGVWRLARSLGLKARLRTGDAKLYGRVTGSHYRVDFSASRNVPVFRLKRKQELLPTELGKRSSSIQIVGCTEVESVPCKCIAVDAADQLFLAGHGCIPTHNTTFAGFLLLLHLCGPEAVRNGHLFSDAQSRDQASILFALAAKIVRMSPDLHASVVIRDTAKQLACPELGTVYHALSAEASTAFGLSPVFVVHDELGLVKGPRSELYEALETASAAQQNPMSVIISTQAPTDADLLSLLIDDALTGADPRIKVEIYSAPLDLDPFSEEAIRLANPHFDEFMNQEEVLRQASDAKRMPSREASYRNLILNQRVEARSPFVSRIVWQENAAKVTGPPKKKVFGGLDLSSVADLTALLLINQVDEVWDVHPTFWLPENGLAEKSRLDRVPYDLWAANGKLITTPGASIEYEFVAEHLRTVFDECEVKAIAFDRYNMKFLKPWLERAGFSEEELTRFIEFGQGFVSMSPAIRALESLLLARKIRHGDHPVLNMCAHNATIVTDPAENRKFVKGRATGRIDGMVALAMAVGVMTINPDDPIKEYKILIL